MVNAQCKRAYQQGELDGLCGIYSLINAYNLLVPNSSKKKSENLFRSLLKSIPKKKWHSYVSHGLCFRDMKKSVKLIDGIEYILPYVKKNEITINELWDRFNSLLHEGEGGCIIISLLGKHSHWSVIQKMTKSELYLVDSIGIKVLRKRDCYVYGEDENTHLIVSHQCLFVRKME